MNKKKTKLQIETEKVEALVQQTNSKIIKLGGHTQHLHENLVIIQSLFDKIRNMPSDKQEEYEKIKLVHMNWKQQVDKIENDYNTAMKNNVGAGISGTLGGVGVVMLGPTAAMGIATTFGVASTGTAISALSGAAATNAALAWLGGGALAAGGGGMAAGNALLALAGPIGWAIAGITILSSGLLIWKAKRNKDKLEKLFLLISKRDQNLYKQAIVELNERISRIINETKMLMEAIINIASFGTDYNKMTEEQQYTLGAYVNLMNSTTQLLVNPILGLQPNFTENDFNRFNSRFYPCVEIRLYCEKNKDLITYVANFLYKIDTDETDRKILAKSFKQNKEFLDKMKIDKDDVDLELFNVVDRILKFTYKNQRQS